MEGLALLVEPKRNSANAYTITLKCGYLQVNRNWFVIVRDI